jgi:hypothetical protein
MARVLEIIPSRSEVNATVAWEGGSAGYAAQNRAVPGRRGCGPR